jgi:hypothetical protein
MGVGGAWPALSHATTAELLADRSQPNEAFAWARDTGSVYQWSAGGNAWVATTHSPPWRYWWKCIPRALLAKVTGVSGATLTLDKTASATATAAKVYFDNTPVINALIAAGADKTTYVFPSGTFMFGGPSATGPNAGASISIRQKDGVRLRGQGKGNTILRSPKGAQSMEINWYQSPGGALSALTVYGNFFLSGGWGWAYPATGGPPVDTKPPSIPSGVAPDFGSHSHVTRDVDFQYTSRCVVSRGADYCSAYRCSCHTDGTLAYVQWLFSWTNGKHCWSYDCSVVSTHLKEAFHCFAQNYSGHVRATAHNGVFAMNSTGACAFESPTVVITANSQYDAAAFSSSDPIFNINQNVDQNRGKPANVVRNMNVVQQGYINRSGDVLVGFNVSGGGINAQCIGGTFRAPDYSGNGGRGPQAANSDRHEIDTLVSGLTCIGAPNPSWGNINVQNGKVIGCAAPQIICNPEGCART